VSQFDPSIHFPKNYLYKEITESLLVLYAWIEDKDFNYAENLAEVIEKIKKLDKTTGGPA